MNSSRSSAAGLVLVLLAALLAQATQAQTVTQAPAPSGEVGPPRQLVPRPEPIDVGPPPKAVPPATPTPGAGPATVGAATPAPAETVVPIATKSATGPVAGPIQVDSLGAVDPSSVGVLDEDQGGLGLDMWAGTPRSLVEKLLPRLPAGTRSHAMQNLMRRLLLSTARVPPGAAATRSLLALRIERLVAAGEMDAVQALLRVSPANLVDSELARAEVAGLLLAGDNSGACARSQAMLRLDDDPYWLKAQSFCKALNNQNAAANLGVALLREQGGEEDTAFVALMAVLTGERAADAVVESLAAPSALHLAMLRAAQQPIPGDAIEGAGPAILRAVATAPNADLDSRLRAAERAEQAGTLTPRALAEIYLSVAFQPEAFASALTTAEADEGPRGRALLFQAAAVETVPVARAEALAKIWLLARERGGFETAARVTADLAETIAPSPELLWFAADAGRALLAAGRIGAARRWLDFATERAAFAEPDGAYAASVLWPLIAIGDREGSLPWSEERLDDWLTRQQELPDEVRAPRVTLMLSVLEGLGYAPAGGRWTTLLDGPLTVSRLMITPALASGLAEAAAAGRIGETVLLALLALGDLAPTQADPGTLAAVVGALRQVGLAEDARALALEALLARGF